MQLWEVKAAKNQASFAWDRSCDFQGSSFQGIRSNIPLTVRIRRKLKSKTLKVRPYGRFVKNDIPLLARISVE